MADREFPRYRTRSLLRLSEPRSGPIRNLNPMPPRPLFVPSRPLTASIPTVLRVILSEAEESTHILTSTPDPRNQKHHVTPHAPIPPTPSSPTPYASLTCRFNLTRRSAGPYHPCGA